MTTDDEVIRRRLLFDGEGAGDDKRLTTLLKTVVKWAMVECEDEERQSNYNKIMASISQCEYAMTKNHLSYEMNIREAENYEQLYTRIEKQIEDTRTEIAECKLELQRARAVRKNKQQYEALARVIETHPERGASQKEIAEARAELDTLNEERNAITRKLELRQKQFHALIFSIQLLQQVLQDDEEAAVTTEDVDDEDMLTDIKTESEAEFIDVDELEEGDENEEGEETTTRYKHSSEKGESKKELIKEEAMLVEEKPVVMDLTEA